MSLATLPINISGQPVGTAADSLHRVSFILKVVQFP
jgi:hypothetical protein